MLLIKIHELINAEGTIAAIYIDKNKDDKLYIQGRFKHEHTKIISKCNRNLLELYLRSQISLKYLLTHDSQFILIQKNQSIRKFIEITSESEPSELNDIACGNSLYDLLPKGMKSRLSVNEILGKLPKVKDGIIMSMIEKVDTKPSNVQFFSEKSTIQLVQLESEIHNPFKFDFLKVNLKTYNSSLLCKANPNLLKLLFMNQITVQDYFKAQAHHEYFYYSDNEWCKFSYSKEIEVMIENIITGNLTYYSLPKEYQVDSVLELWDQYTKNFVLPGGYGVLPVDFEKGYQVNVQLK